MKLPEQHIKIHIDPTAPILDQLSEARIFSAYKKDDGVCFNECCDYYFEATLTKKEVLQLAQELIDLANTI